MRIVHWIKQFYPYFGGGETALYDLCKYVENVPEIKENIIITTKLPGTKQKEKLFKKTLIHRIGLPTEYNKDSKPALLVKNTVRDLSLSNTLKKYVNNDTIIHVHGPMPVPFAFRYFKKLFSFSKHFRPWENFNAPIIMHYHGELQHDRDWIANRDYEKSKKVICVDHYTGRAFANKSKVVFIPNGVDTGQFKPLKLERKWITFIGRIIPVKGWKIYAQAVKGMKNTLMIGHGTQENEARKIFQGRILESVPNKEMKEYYSKSNLVICPFQNPGLSRVAMEAMACGCIVIKSDIDPPPVVDGVNGFTFKYDSADDLRRVITKALNISEKKTENMRNKSRETIIKNYSSKTMVKKIIEIYRGVK